jgi:hypothetical protein
MNAKANLPLPLELTQPVAMATDLSTALVGSKTSYNPETQMSSPAVDWEGRGHHHGKRTNSKCFNGGFIQIDDILQDFHL